MSLLPSEYLKNVDDIYKVRLIEPNEPNFEFIDRSDLIKEAKSFLSSIQSLPLTAKTDRLHNLPLLVNGPRGSGKSRFVDEFAESIKSENSLTIPITYKEIMKNNTLFGLSKLECFYYRVLYS